MSVINDLEDEDEIEIRIFGNAKQIEEALACLDEIKGVDWECVQK